MSERGVGEVRESEAHEAPLAASREELAGQVAELEGTVQTIWNLVSSVSARMVRALDELRQEMNRRVSPADLEHIHGELERIRAKVDDIVDEVGYDESLDIAKVPPAILEAAYQTILDDIVDELKDVCGTHDAEQHITSALEQVRLKTSGSELFQYRPHRIHVGVARALEKRLASARQVHMTFEELLPLLLEPIEYYKPRNFRALIKNKSHEYAVHRAVALSAPDRTNPEHDALQARVNRLEEQVAGALRDVRDFAERLRVTLAGVASQESVESIGMRLVSIEQRIARPAMTTGESHPSRLVDGDAPADRVLAALRRGPHSLAALERALGLERGALREALADLERRALVSSSRRGRYLMYRAKEEREDA